MLQVGPTQYRSQTVFEDVSPMMVRDFFWDDEFRGVWDDMLIFTKTLEECKETGSAIVQWVRKVCSRIFYLYSHPFIQWGIFVGSWSPMIFHWLLCIHHQEFLSTCGACSLIAKAIWHPKMSLIFNKPIRIVFVQTSTDYLQAYTTNFQKSKVLYTNQPTSDPKSC